MQRGTLLLALACLTGCYGGARASRGVNAAWQGRAVAQLEAQWGPPAEVRGDRRDWVITGEHLELPGGSASLTIDPTGIEGHAELRAGSRTTVEVARVSVVVDGAGRIASMQGASLRWGAPRGSNHRHGFLMGFHAGMGRLEDTATWLPGGGVYLGGMLGPRLGLVGQLSLASGKDAEGGAMGLAAGLGPQWWPMARLWLRAGAAMVIDWDPGFEDAALRPGLAMAASYALVRAGSFVLDLRLDSVTTPASAFGVVGLGVNVN